MLKKFLCICLAATSGIMACSVLPPYCVEAYRAVGIRNVGNSCYLNSCLQQLYRSPVKDFILSMPVADKKTKPTLNAIWNIFNEMDCAVHPAVNVQVYIHQLGKEIYSGAQMDSAETFYKIIDKLDSELEDPAHPISAILNIGLSTTVKCSMCGNISLTNVNEIALSLPLLCNLNASILKYISNENLTDRTHCVAIGDRPSIVSRRTKITATSDTFVITLNRFVHEGKAQKKLNGQMAFPESLNTRLFNRELNQNYNLTGVIMHSGSCGGGHYFSYVKSPEGCWNELNDSSVKPIPSFASISKQCYGSNESGTNAYVLFYSKSGPTAK